MNELHLLFNTSALMPPECDVYIWWVGYKGLSTCIDFKYDVIKGYIHITRLVEHEYIKNHLIKSII